MRLIRGAPGAGKTALVFREFKQAIASGEPARIVVPTATLVRHYQHELARDGLVFSPKLIVSLARLTGAGTSDAVMKSIIRQELLHGNYPEFSTVSATKGLVETILETIALFENAAGTPDRLDALRKPGPNAAAFIRLWKVVDASVRARHLPNRVQRIRSVIADPPKGKVWFDGFLSFSPLEWRLVTALSASADLALTLPDLPAFDDIRRAAMALGAKDVPIYDVFRKPAQTTVEAPSVEREADEIARRVIDLHHGGIELREIGVAVRDHATYLPLLKGTFARFQIPARFLFREPLAQQPAASFLNGLVSSAINGWDFAEALKAFRAHPAWGRSAWFDKFEFRVREAMPDRGADALLTHCEDPADADKLAVCITAAGATGVNVRAKDWAHRLTTMAQRLFRPGMLAVAGTARDVASDRTWAAGLRAWLEAVSGAVECWADPEETISLQTFWDTARDCVESATFTIPDDRGDVVHVMDVFEARQWNVEALFICGMTSRDFPKASSPNLLFSEAELDRLVNGGVKVRRGSDVERQEEALRISLQSRASQSLIITSPARDASGRLTERSTWFTAEPTGFRPSSLIPRVAPPNGARAGAIHHPELLSILAAQHSRLSATSLEDLVLCRFKFFAGRSLNLRKPPDSPRDRLNPRNVGNIIHKAMELWMSGNHTGNLVEIFDREFANTVREKRLLPGYALEVDRLFWRNIAARLIGQFNWPVVSSESEAILTATLPDGTAVDCRIDRLDLLANNECIIIDYKTGAIKGIKDNTKNTAKLQGPLYALAAHQQRELRTVAMMYIALRTEETFGWGEVGNLKLEPMPDGWMEAGRDRAAARLEAFLSGEVFAEPSDEAQCKWCDYAKACRFGQRQALVLVEGAHGA